MKRAWNTQNWVHRFVATWLGIIETDAFLAYRHFHTAGQSTDHNTFTSKVALALAKMGHGLDQTLMNLSGPNFRSTKVHQLSGNCKNLNKLSVVLTVGEFAQFVKRRARFVAKIVRQLHILRDMLL
eukprot:Pompholyxophrys_punicea_v1_NODE_50_length_4350_cov_57.873807.p2 type:complete len:126 gc:universal NODE_50_length_4350_cov_57.873807:3955-4332(+)